MSMVIYGPPAREKIRYKHKLKRLFGCKTALDGVVPLEGGGFRDGRGIARRYVPADTLVITDLDGAEARKFANAQEIRNVWHFDEAMRAAKSKGVVPA